MADAQELAGDFETQSELGRTSLVVEFFQFLAHSKKWWLLPIVTVLCLVGALVMLGGTSVAPFIYTLF